MYADAAECVGELYRQSGQHQNRRRACRASVLLIRGRCALQSAVAAITAASYSDAGAPKIANWSVSRSSEHAFAPLEDHRRASIRLL